MADAVAFTTISKENGATGMDNDDPTEMLSFQKYHGLGNDFILVDNRHSSEPCLTPQQAMQLCDRNFGIGGDGVIFALQSSSDEKTAAAAAADYAMRIYNSDGSEPEMCGNGIRCLARFVHSLDTATATQTSSKGDSTSTTISYTIDTLAGPIVPVINADGTVTVDMGEPIFKASEIPTTLAPNMASDDSVVEQEVVAPNDPTKVWKISTVSMGNPHAVIFVNDLEQDVNLLEDGFALQAATDLFPKRINVEFVQVVSDHHLLMKVYERGAGPTLACGTGACALTVAAIRAGKIPPTTPEQPCRVTLPGGDLFIEWNPEISNKVFMTGPATLAFLGQVPMPQ